MINKETIGKRLKEERLKAGISLEELAQDTGILCSTLSKYETEGISDIEKINDICIALNILPEIILDFKQEINVKDNINNVIYDKDNITIITENEGFISGLNQIDCSIKMNKNIVCLSTDNKIFGQKFEELRKNDYDIRLLDFVNLNADGYSPLQYITNDRDIIEFARYFIVNIHKKSDINILFCALIAFLLKYRPKDEQHFTSIAKLLATFADCNNIPPHVQTVLDKIFNEIEQNDPNSIAIRQYNMFKAVDPSLAKKQINELLNLLLPYTADDLEEFIKYDTVQINKLCDKNSKIAIFAIAPINETLSPLYETFKYQLYKVLKEDYLKNNINTYNKNIDNFINERKKFRKITYLTLEEVTNLISSSEIQIKRLEMSRHVKDTKIDIESINKKIRVLNEKIYEYRQLKFLLILKKYKTYKEINENTEKKE